MPSSTPSFGAGVELGYARALGMPIVCSGATTRSIFCALGEEFDTDGAAFEFVVRLAA